MKILVIGASGFIGNACYNYFSEKHETVGVDCINKSSNKILIDSDNTLIPVLIAKKFDVILNCAGSSNIQNSFTNTANDLKLNVTFVKDILELIKNSSPDTKIINLSSAAVYGNPTELPIQESAETKPLSPYGFHKLKSEQLLEEYNRIYKINTLSVRIFSAYGPGLKRQFFYDLYSKFNLNNSTVALYGTGNESRDFIFVTDIINALEILIRNGLFKGEVYNVASGEESYINNAAKVFSKVANYPGTITFTNEQIEGYPINWKANIRKLSALGFSPKIKLEEGLKLYYNWLKNEKV